MKKLSFARFLRGCCIAFLLLFIFLSQMYYSNGLYKSAIWIEKTYQDHTTKSAASVTALMTPDIIKKNKELIKKNTLENAVFIEGGEFTMGAENCDNYAPTLSQCAASPVYPVKLTSYSMLKFKITNRDFDTFQADIGKYINPYRDSNDKERWENVHRHGELPAIINWTMANDYCQWLGKLTGLPVSLPTEAQWEFAARNRGQYIGFMTNNNKIEPGVNVPSYQMRRAIKGSYFTPVGQFPPSSLGLYDLSGNGLEWVNDWYSSEKPSGQSPFVDPQGPTQGYLSNEGPAKVLRPYNDDAEENGIGVTVHDRNYAAVSASVDFSSPYTARCAVNLAQRIATHE
ncbi:formylglycine-generating enzyme family protein [Klebsiella aerogenes]|uniref:formylglycine-generating enzyme family protein n=1 Tax=Klebsiella aerogenes TaxID=548 RepID=UPI0006999E88|nr:SUMF1/EgtB/PvdO family nonheme iron enzyme [Klebsiella aerogenes]